MIYDILGEKDKEFFKLFEKMGYYNPPETYFPLPKIFYLDIGKLFKGKIEYQTIQKNGMDITVKELIGLLEDIKKNEGIK